MKGKTKIILQKCIITIFIILFSYTGVSKLFDHGVLQDQIASFPFFASAALYISKTLPWAEFSIALLLIVPRYRLVGLYFSLMLVTLFAIYIIVLPESNRNSLCGCGGIIGFLSWNQHIIFNFFLIILAIIALVLRQVEIGKRLTKDNFVTK